MIQNVTLAGINFPVEFHFLSTWIRYFHDFSEKKGKWDYPECICVSEAELQKRQRKYPEDSFMEFQLLLFRFCQILPHCGCCMFHSVAFELGKKAWLLTAPSGTGKSTLYAHLRNRCRDSITLISGDKTILKFEDSGKIIAAGSPWTGKEGWRGTGTGTLAGIFLLEQGSENHIRRMTVKESVLPLYSQFLYEPETEAESCLMCVMLEKLLSTVPVWKLVNIGDPACAGLTLRIMEGENVW